MAAPKRIEILARGLWQRGTTLLVCRNVEQRHCYLPGGHVEPGEAATRALVRELQEEAGEAIRVGDLCLVSEHRFVQAGKSRHELNLVFHVEREGLDDPEQPIRSLEPDIAFEWVERDDLKSEGFVPTSLIPALAAMMPARPSARHRAPLRSTVTGSAGAPTAAIVPTDGVSADPSAPTATFIADEG